MVSQDDQPVAQLAPRGDDATIQLGFVHDGVLARYAIGAYRLRPDGVVPDGAFLAWRSPLSE